MKVVMLFKRKPGITFEQFREHYEKSHAPLAARLLPYFKSYTRNFVRHDMSYKSSTLGGEVNFDVVTELTFESKEDYDRMTKALTDPAVYNQIVQDEEQFMDRSPGGRLIFFVDEEKTPQSMLR
jgi:uncharacterized protein (TIGR02118 family)